MFTYLARHELESMLINVIILLLFLILFFHVIVMIMITFMIVIISPTDSMRQRECCSAYMTPTLWPLAKTTGAPT